jgi:uncharacterized protein
MKIWIKRLGISLLGLLGLCAAVIIISGFAAEIPGEKKLAGGMQRNIARYVTMPDGTKIAVDIWLPADYKVGQKLPAIIHSTRY